jgi:hypothetical protein
MGSRLAGVTEMRAGGPVHPLAGDPPQLTGIGTIDVTLALAGVS